MGTTLAQQAWTLEITGEPVRRCNDTLRGLVSLPLQRDPGAGLAATVVEQEPLGVRLAGHDGG